MPKRSHTHQFETDSFGDISTFLASLCISQSVGMTVRISSPKFSAWGSQSNYMSRYSPPTRVSSYLVGKMNLISAPHSIGRRQLSQGRKDIVHNQGDPCIVLLMRTQISQYQLHFTRRVESFLDSFCIRFGFKFLLRWHPDYEEKSTSLPNFFIVHRAGLGATPQ